MTAIAGAGGFSLESLLKMFQTIQTPEGLDQVASLAAAKGPPPVLPPVGQLPPDQPAVGTAGMLQQGAFQDIIDPSVGQGIPGLGQPQFQNNPQQIALNPLPNPVISPAPEVAAPEAGRLPVGFTPQQAQLLSSLSTQPPRRPLSGVLPRRSGGNIQTSPVPVPSQSAPRLTLAQLIGGR